MAKENQSKTYRLFNWTKKNKLLSASLGTMIFGMSIVIAGPVIYFTTFYDELNPPARVQRVYRINKSLNEKLTLRDLLDQNLKESIEKRAYTLEAEKSEIINSPNFDEEKTRYEQVLAKYESKEQLGLAVGLVGCLMTLSGGLVSMVVSKNPIDKELGFP